MLNDNVIKSDQADTKDDDKAVDLKENLQAE
jgi:hypothetical protein